MKKDMNYQRVLLDVAMRKALESQYNNISNRNNQLELLIKVWIGLFLITGMLGIILLTALLISHPASMFILCGSIVFIFILKFVGGGR